MESKAKNSGTNNKIERNFVNLNLISRHLICTICQEVFDDPSRINCGHTFCRDCLVSWIDKSNKCPMCRVPVKKEDLHRDLIAFNIISDLEVTCIHKGCPWKSTLNNLVEHVKFCYFDPKKMNANIKQFLTKNNDSNKNNDLEDNNTNNEYLEFNSNVGLKARLYNKNKELIEKVILGESSNKSKSEKNESLLDMVCPTISKSSKKLYDYSEM
jgi:hypothetical protein